MAEVMPKVKKSLYSLDIQKFSRICFVLIALVMFYFSSQPGDESNYLSDSVAEIIHIESDGGYLHVSVQPLLLGLNLRKMAHIGIFAALGMLAFLSQDEWISVGKRVSLAILVSYFYACFDEFHQTLVPDRAGSFGDTIIDFIGILLGVLFILVMQRILTRYLHRHIYNV